MNHSAKLKENILIAISGWPYNYHNLHFTKSEYLAEWFQAKSCGELSYLLFHMLPGIKKQQKGGEEEFRLFIF